jgi:hypothetical protein
MQGSASTRSEASQHNSPIPLCVCGLVHLHDLTLFVGFAFDALENSSSPRAVSRGDTWQHQAEATRLEGHAAAVSALARLSHGRLASGV